MAGATPERRRRRSVVVLGLLVATCASTLSPAYAADDPQQRKQAVQDQLAQTKQAIDEDSAALTAATQAYAEVNAKIPGAQAALATAQQSLQAANDAVLRAQAELAAARVADQRAAEALTAAEQAVKDCQGRIEEITARIDTRRNQMGQVAAHAYQQGGMSGITDLMAVLESNSLDEFNTRVTYYQTAISSDGTIIHGLEDDRTALAAEKVRLQGLQDAATAARKQAADALTHTSALEKQARGAQATATANANTAAAAQAQVQVLVAARQQAVGAAQAAQAADNQQYAQLDQQRQSIDAEIAELARQAAIAEAARQAELARQAEAARQAAVAQAAAEQAAAAAAAKAAGKPAPPVVQPPAALPAPALAAAARSAAASGWGLRIPLDIPTYVTSPYGMRLHPVTHIYKLHDGMDLHSGCNTAVLAARSGTVSWARTLVGYGNQVLLDHGSVNGHELMTSYSHLTSWVVAAGQQVAQGDVIGYSGTTGFSTACHLHLMVYVDGTMTNPAPYFPSVG